MADRGAGTTNGECPAITEPDGFLPSENEVFPISGRRFQEEFDEDIRATLDLNTWSVGSDLHQEYRRIEREVGEAERLECIQEKKIRQELFPLLAKLPNMPPNAGAHQADPEAIRAIHRGLLFNGGVEACDGTIQIHDSLPLTIYQIGVSLVSYRGDQGTWAQRLFRRDLRQKGAEVEEWIEFLERRANRDPSTRPPGEEGLGALVQKALLDYAERAILLRRSQSVWRIGHGNPITYELLTGGGNLELMVEATRMLRELLENHQKVVFISNEPRDRLFLTIGQALRPMEYAIVGRLDDRLKTWIHQERFTAGPSAMLSWDEECVSPAEWIPRFLERVASKIVVGVFRATLLAPTQVFYAHEDHSEIAAHLALADCMLREQGTSLLLGIARHVCDSVFGDNLEMLASSAYAAAGAYRRGFSARSRRIR
ncbi:MAG TPA: hypothetical protein VKU02_29065 [Gemmataceae bacterium]|nr:hypothetical protein [Gemmataceae bacterium]